MKVIKDSWTIKSPVLIGLRNCSIAGLHPPALKQATENDAVFIKRKTKFYTIAVRDEQGGLVYPSASWFPDMVPGKQKSLCSLIFLKLFYLFFAKGKSPWTDMSNPAKREDLLWHDNNDHYPSCFSPRWHELWLSTLHKGLARTFG